MSLSHLYDDFSAIAPAVSNVSHQTIVEDTEDETRLAVFEDGYKAGWEDAVKAKDDEAGRLNEEFVQQLQDISFTYHEAFAKLKSATAPLLTDFVLKLLPRAAHGAVKAQLIDQLDALIEGQAEKSVELAVAPEKAEEVEALLEGRLDIPFRIAPEAVLSSNQVYLRVGKKEREINLDAVLDGINQAVDAYLNSAGSEPEDG